MGNKIVNQNSLRLTLGFAFRALAALFVIANLAACAKQGFGSVPEGGPSSSSSAPGSGGANGGDGSGAHGSINTQGSSDGASSGSSSGSGSPGGAIAANGPGPAIVGNTLTYDGVNAKAYFTAPLCQRGTLCLGTFVLRQTLTAPLAFDWHTDDTIYQHPLADGGAPYGAPNVDYIPTGGRLVFPAGVTSIDVHIQDISPNNVAIRIGVTMVNCTYGGVAIDCQALFQ